MENKKLTKPTSRNSKSLKMISIRVTTEIAQLLKSDLTKINDKKLGKNIKISEYLKLCRSLISEENIKSLRENSLSNSDRLEMFFQNYVLTNEKISKDAFLGKVLNGEIKTAQNLDQTLA